MAVSPTISVVIPTYNRRDALPVVLGPLLAEPDAHEVVVVVDGSTDGSAQLLRELAERDPRLRPIVIENQGWTVARMTGVEAARGEVVLMIDDDVRLHSGTVAGHARHHAAAERLLVVGAMPVLSGPQRDRHDFARALYARAYQRHTSRWRENPELVLPTFWEGHLSIRRGDLLALPEADPELARGYHSDIDFGLRCARAGLTGVFDPELRAEHLIERTQDAYLRTAYRSGAGRVRLHRAHADLIGPLPADFAVAGLTWPERELVRRSRTQRWPVGLTSALLRGLGYVRLYKLQRRAAALWAAMERDRGAREQQAEPSRSS
jgi:glycosyltransferase involved in cell wall biosynthesis